MKYQCKICQKEIEDFKVPDNWIGIPTSKGFKYYCNNHIEDIILTSNDIKKIESNMLGYFYMKLLKDKGCYISHETEWGIYMDLEYRFGQRLVEHILEKA